MTALVKELRNKVTDLDSQLSYQKQHAETLVEKCEKQEQEYNCTCRSYKEEQVAKQETTNHTEN